MNARYPVYPGSRAACRFFAILAGVAGQKKGSLGTSSHVVGPRRKGKGVQKRLDERQAKLSGPVRVYFVDPKTL